MTTPARDPRRDPEPEDVIERIDVSRRVVRVFQDGKARTQVTYKQPLDGLPRTCGLGSWRRWAVGSIVVTVGGSEVRDDA